MIEYVRQIITGQFEAALSMLNECVRMCPPEHWEGKIANDAFRQIAYHALFYVDLYLSPSEEAFKLREFHRRGGDERSPALSPGLSQEDTLAYAAICRQKMIDTLAAETRESMQGPSGFSWRKFSRGELYIYTLRHVQHHAGSMSAYLRRIDRALPDLKALPWVATGWR
ncbi:MAG TPA: DinB family protein [Phycisphaerae bacterium]|nr:DinB family protein [Phycisphaerae bacterium]